MANHINSTWRICMLIGVMFVACRKESPEPTPPATSGGSLSEVQPVVLKPNVIVCDSMVLHLDWNEAELDQGNFVFTVNGNAPTIAVGDIIVGSQQEGFLRKVDAVSLNGNTMTLQTSDAVLEDAIASGGFTFSNDLSELEERSLGFERSIDNRVLVQQGALTVTIDHAELSLVSNWNATADFNLTGLKYFDLSTTDAQLNGSITLHVVANQATDLATVDNTIARFQRTAVVWSGGLPVVVTTYVNLKAQFGAQIEASMDRTISFNIQSVSDLGINYNNDAWTTTHTMENSGSVTSSSTSGQATLTANLALVPEVSFKLYRVVGPYFQPSLQESLRAQVSSPDLNWDFKADAWLRAVLGVRAGIFSHTWADYSTPPWDTDHLVYRTPFRIERVSVDGQVGNAGEALANPIRVRVLDSNGAPQRNVPVFFTVTEGGGGCTPSSILSDDQGYAECSWSLGSGTEPQHLTANVKYGDNTPVNDAPLIFTATTAAEDTILYCANLDPTNSGGVSHCACYQDGLGAAVDVYYSCGSVSVNLMVHRINGVPTSATFTSSGVATWDYSVVAQNETSCPGSYGGCDDGLGLGNVVYNMCGYNYPTSPVALIFTTPTVFGSTDLLWSGLLQGSQAVLTYNGREYVLDPC